MTLRPTYEELERKPKVERNRTERGQGESEESFLAKKPVAFIAGILILFGLYLSSLYNYLLFHSLAEIFSIVVAWTIFILAWNSRRIMDNNYLLFIGIAYLFIGALDLVHTLGYRGMGIFHGYAANLPTQLWIAARYMESLSLLIAPLFLARRLRADLVLMVYALVTALVLGSVFYWHIFPTCFVEGIGLTPFKKISEYIISIILIGAITLLLQKRKEFDERVFRLLVAAMVITIAAELAFTFYISAYGFSNLVGHYFKIISFYLIYKAIIETGLTRPYNLLFRSLKQSEDVLRESEANYRRLSENSPAVVYQLIMTPEGTFTFPYVSHMVTATMGISAEDVMKDSSQLLDMVHPEDQEMFREDVMRSAESLESFPITFRCLKDGEVIWIEARGTPEPLTDGGILWDGLFFDITKRKQMEEEFLKAKKLESLGVLAGGIAHDFNNLMTSVVGNISLAKMEMKPGSEAFISLVEAQKASIQTKELTARLITFSKGGGPIKETASIGNLVKDSVDFSLKGSDIDARFSIPDDISPVEIDEEQMKQVIHNIITNAQEAMAGQGTINVSCENADIGVKDTLTLKDGKYVKISIEDQGPGIPEADLIKIFDPYFSTKQMGAQKGMGLGLTISDSIIKQHDGLITVESELGTGATFSIYLPASEKEIVEAAPVKKPAPEQLVPRGGKILVMDDEELVRDVSNGLLTRIGYKVEVAVEGVEAIEMYRKAMESEKPFDMVILDLTNKVGMGGLETIERLLEIDPDVKAIVATGYSTDPIISKFREHGFRGSLPKPFTLDQLRTALDDAIAGE